MAWPMAWSRCVLPSPESPWRKSGFQVWPGLLGHGLGGGEGEVVRLADHEGLEGVAGAGAALPLLGDGGWAARAWSPRRLVRGGGPRAVVDHEGPPRSEVPVTAGRNSSNQAR